MTNPDDNAFADLARSVLPEQTSGRLSRMFNVNQRIAQRWMSGDLEAPSDVVEKLQQQQKILEVFHPGAELTRLISTAYDRGLDTEVTAAFLSSAYEVLLQRKIR